MISPSPPAPRPGFFLSLKWKALLLSSIALILMTGALVTINHIELHNQFEQRRLELQNQYARQAQGLLDQSDQRLRQWSTIIASMLDIRVAFEQSREVRMIAEIERLAPILGLDMGLQSILLVSATGQHLTVHGLDENSEGGVALREATRRVMTTETPTSLIDCVDTCLQYSIVPILGTGGVLVVGVSLADVVLDFQRVAGIDLGLIVEQPQPRSHDDGKRWLPQWGAQVVALGNPQVNMEILRMAAVNTLTDTVREPIYVDANRREYEVRLFPLTGFGEGEGAYLAIIADISDAIARIRVAFQRNITLGVFGLALSELMLLGILWAPMSRLRHAADKLPWLATGAFAKVREAISDMRLTHFIRDEVDVLNDIAIAVSFQLEALNVEVANRTRDLSERMKEITQQRNFVTHILETAQAIILTQDRNNAILTINPYGQTISGYSLQELQGRPFVTLLAEEGIDSICEQLAELVVGTREHIEEERDLFCKDHSLSNIVWQHSRLRGHAEGTPVILSVGMDITARKKAELQLAWLADHDPLTGLYNRRRFTQELNDAVAAARRYRYSSALLFVDLDQFKYINDTSGHHAGDRLLQRLGALLPAILREVDVIGRLGGDEFAVILNRTTADEAVQVTRKILAHICEIEFQVDERVHKLSASIGIALFPEHSANIEDLLARADLAMYQVKESGRGGWHLLSIEDQSQRRMSERVFWKQRVEHALKEDRFLLYAQPILRIRDHVISHYEVLLRMRGDDGEISGPAQFIEVAERSGLIHSIDRMVVSEAIRHQVVAKEQGWRLFLTVNLSAHAFNNPDLLGYLKQLLQDTQIDPQQLVFEITETAALADLTAAHRLMKAINDLGCHFALDDFGTGFSSFYYLKTLPFKFIKIDGSFINKLGERRDDQILVKGIGEIARGFGKKTIAEQVEDEESFSRLAEYNIDYAQGYYIGRPVPITRILEENQRAVSHGLQLSINEKSV
ncbi:MAG: EAL domain-containing protein [Candidatus Competibacteraceae bacterium]|nr:MAG: EAL domain-containing protein [Candidatus Competibacteraceae bacterium]